jgi:hypothetical protein
LLLLPLCPAHAPHFLQQMRYCDSWESQNREVTHAA